MAGVSEARVRVLSVQAGQVVLEPMQQDGCGGCGARAACGVSALGKHFASQPRQMTLACAQAVQPGDELQLDMPESDLLKAGVLAYLLPSVLTIVGAALATPLGDGAAMLGALAGLLPGLWLMRRWQPQPVLRPPSPLSNAHFSKESI